MFEVEKALSQHRVRVCRQVHVCVHDFHIDVGVDEEFRCDVVMPNSVLSDEIGAGFSLLFGSKVLGASVFLDLADAVRRGRIITPAPKATVPDYIGLYGPANSIVVLEAKGTQTKGRCSARQIPKGCKQVGSVSLPSGRSTVRLVVGTELHRDDSLYDTTVFVGDPPEDRAYRYFQHETPESLAVRDHYRRIAALIGDAELLTRMERPQAFERVAARLVGREVGNLKALGSTFEVRSPIGTAGFFVGMNVPTRESLLSTTPDVERPQVPSVIPETGRHRDARRLSSYSVSRDGSVL